VKYIRTKDIVQRYYKSLEEKSDDWKDIYSDDVVFSDASQVLLAKGKEEVVKALILFLNGVTGVKIKELIVEDDRSCAIISYDYVNSKKERMNQDVAEILEVKNGKLTKQTIYFDLTAFRTFMSS
jgi:ketosteroid isomerase-like protein